MLNRVVGQCGLGGGASQDGSQIKLTLVTALCFKISLPILPQVIHYKKYVASGIQKKKTQKTNQTVTVAVVLKSSGYMASRIVFYVFLCLSVSIWHIFYRMFYIEKYTLMHLQ